MQKIWAFGDSFTDRYILSNNSAYTNWKGYTPKIFSEIISEKLNYPVESIASGGIDNYTIFESVCERIHKIDNDIVIIGWTDVCRFRMVDSHYDSWRPASPVMGLRRKRGLPYINGVFDDTIEDIFINRTHNLWKNEINNWCKLINKSLNNSIVIHWTWSEGVLRETISEETNNKIIDFHYSEKGHFDLANWIIDKIKLNEPMLPYKKESIL